MIKRIIKKTIPRKQLYSFYIIRNYLLWKLIFTYIYIQNLFNRKNIDKRKISIALPTYNRANMFYDSIKYIINDNRVTEIIISDDWSKDINLLEQKIKTIDNNKIKLIKNYENQWPFINKSISVKNCSNDFVILLDSDNIIQKDYIDKLYSISDWNSNTFYCPDFAYPQFNFKIPIINTVDINNINYIIKNYKTFLNIWNFFINKKYYTSIVTISKQYYIDCRSYDVMYINILWIMLKWLKLVKINWLQYYHRIHKWSNFLSKTKYASSNNTLNKILNLIKK
jgi:glycosyltransferase involved in cell wall biosynthesis